MNADVGPLATEAGLLLDAVAERLTSKRGGTVGADGEPAAACPTCGHQPGESCTACPICRFLAVLRGERPEVSERWVDSALTIVQALRSLIPTPDAPPEGPNPTGPPPPTDPPPRLQHIEIQ